MGAAKSVNITDNTVEAFVNLTTDIYAGATVSADSVQLVDINGNDIQVGDIGQDVYIKIDMKAVFNQFASTEVQQSLIMDITQEATSALSDLNVLQFADASNYLYAYMRSVIDISTSMEARCDASVTITQQVTVSGNNITIGDINQSGLVEAVQECVADQVSQSTAIQDLENYVPQAATATAEGLNLDWLIVICVCGVVALGIIVGIPTVVAGSTIASNLPFFAGVILLIVGGVLMGLGEVFRGYHVSTTPYVNQTITEMCGRGETVERTDISSVTLARNELEDNDEYVAFDFRPVATYKYGFPVLQSPPITTFHRSITSTCQALDASNQVTFSETPDLVLYRYPHFFIGVTNDQGTPVIDTNTEVVDYVDGTSLPQNGDIFIVRETLQWFLYNGRTWDPQVLPTDFPQIPSDPGRRIYINRTPGEVDEPINPNQLVTSENDIVINAYTPSRLQVYVPNGEVGSMDWVMADEPIIGANFVVADCTTDEECVNYAGIKRRDGYNWIYGVIGAVCLGVGVVSIIYGFITKSRRGGQSEPPKKSTKK